MVIVPTNVPALAFAGILIITEVNPSEHPRIRHIINDFAEVFILDDNAWCIGMRYRNRMTPAVRSLENLDRSASSGPMPDNLGNRRLGCTG